MSTTSQRRRILAWLRRGRKLTPLGAQDRFGCLRLGARVWELRGEGWPIRTTMVCVRNRYGENVRVAEYRMEGR